MQNDEAVLATMAGAALAVAVPVTLRQLDVIERLPDVPWRGFDANKVTTSPEAYPIGGIPDGIAACLLYTAELGLVLSRRRQRRLGRSTAWIDRLLAAAIGGGAVGALYYGYQMAAVEKKVCVYCLSNIALNLAMVPFAWRMLRGRSR
ncbi:MAG: hypothetical protein LC659_14160 [Myxococcales bacterium]|nr:hypothetical protein [Myxococcales bacterium]